MTERHELPRFLELWEYLQSKMQDLASEASAKSFCDVNGIVNLAVESGRSADLRLGIKYMPEAGRILPLGDNERLWLERHFGMELTYAKTDQYDEGGGYIYYDMSYPSADRAKELYPNWPTGRYWTGGNWG